jgi:hypothetical protein
MKLNNEIYFIEIFWRLYEQALVKWGYRYELIQLQYTNVNFFFQC